MRLAAKWQLAWTIHTDGIERRTVESVRIDGEWVDVVRLGRGEPLVLVPGLAGSWKLLLPLAEMLALHFEVVTYGLRGDHFPSGSLGPDRGRVGDIGQHAHDLACLLDQLELECPTVFGVSFGGAIALELAAECSHRIGALDRERRGGSVSTHTRLDDSRGACSSDSLCPTTTASSINSSTCSMVRSRTRARSLIS